MIKKLVLVMSILSLSTLSFAKETKAGKRKPANSSSAGCTGYANLGDLVGDAAKIEFSSGKQGVADQFTVEGLDVANGKDVSDISRLIASKSEIPYKYENKEATMKIILDAKPLSSADETRGTYKIYRFSVSVADKTVGAGACRTYNYEF